MAGEKNEEKLLRSAALQNAASILQARQRAEAELVRARDELQRKAAEQAEALSILRATLEATTNGILVVDERGKVTGYNEAFLRMWHLPRAVIEPADHEKLFEWVQQRVKNPAAFVARAREIYAASPAETTDVVELSDGRVFERHSRRQIVNGQSTGRVWSFHDITQRQLAERELRQQREWFQVTLSSIGDAVITTDVDAIVTFLNPVAEKMTGWKLSDAVGQPLGNVFRIVDETTGAFAVNPVARVLREGKIVGLGNHTALIARDGKEIAIEDSAAPIRDPAGKISGAVMVFHDVTLRRQAEAKLRARERELSLIYHNVSDVIFYLGAEPGGQFRFLSVNQAFLAATGLPEESVVGRLVADVIPEPSLSLVLDKYREAIREKHTVRWEETTHYPSGEKVGVVSVTPIFDTAGHCSNLIGTVHDVSERKRAEEVRARLAAVVESSDEAIISKTLDGIITTWNRGAERMFGYTAKEAIGKPVTILIPHERENEEAMILARLRRGERVEHYETVRIRKDGTPLKISLTSSPLRDSEGKIIGASKIAHDITGRKKMEEQLRQSEARFRLIGEVVPQMIWTADTAGNIEYYNERWENYIGPDMQAASPTRRNAVHPDDRDRAVKSWENSVRTGEPFEIEYRLRRHDGVHRWFVARAVPLRDPNGVILRWYGSATDIHQQKLDAEALREESVITEQLNQVARALATELELPKIVQLITDVGTRITRAQFGAFFYNVPDDQGGSYMLYTLSGVPRAAFEKFPMPRATALFGPTFRGEGVIRLDDVRQDSRFGQNTPHRGMPPGHLPVVSYLAVPVTSRSGEVLGGLFFGHSEPGIFKERDEKIIVGVAAQAAAAMDNARLYQAEQQARAAAEQASRTKDQFLAMLSHELRTPLTPVLAILSSLAEGPAVSEALAHDLETMKRNIELEARLIDDLLDLTRVTRGKLELQPERVSVARLIENTISTCQPELAAKRLNIVREIAQPRQEIFADGARVTQILWNLLKNSVKFTPEGGTITIRARTEFAPGNERVIIEVQDTGIGIESSQIEHVFEAFEQGSRQITRQYGGLGLGLAISRAIAEAHHGTITAASEGPDRGSTFTLTLPVKAVPEPPPAPFVSREVSAAITVPGRPDTARRPLRILLVEDHLDTANIMIRMLRRTGYEVVHAASLAAGREIGEAEMHGAGIDLVISDLSLPDGSGLDLMRELSTKYGLRGIALSGFGMDTDRAQTSAAGFSRHLTKPVNIALVRSTIAEIMKGN